MLIIPAIDLLDGNVVRLRKGVMEDSVKYGFSPLEAAKMFADMGATRIHIVDLNGARTGESVNYKHIEDIATKINIDVEVGGGIRNMERLQDYLNIGVSYGILGTVTIKNPDFVCEALEKYPYKIILGLDAREGMVVTEGWYENSNITVAQVLERFAHLKAESIIVTDVEKDGMLQGVNLTMINEVAKISPFPVIASGGVSTIDDINKLRKLLNPNIKGCIVGKAFYEGKMDLNEAFPTNE